MKTHRGDQRAQEKAEDLIFLKAKEGRCVQEGDGGQRFPVLQEDLEEMCGIMLVWSFPGGPHVTPMTRLLSTFLADL